MKREEEEVEEEDEEVVDWRGPQVLRETETCDDWDNKGDEGETGRRNVELDDDADDMTAGDKDGAELRWL